MKVQQDKSRSILRGFGIDLEKGVYKDNEENRKLNRVGQHWGKGDKSDSLEKHPMWSESDYKHLSGKGYTNKEIKKIWDRDQKEGKSPVGPKVPEKIRKIREMMEKEKRETRRNSASQQVDDANDKSPSTLSLVERRQKADANTIVDLNSKLKFYEEKAKKWESEKGEVYGREKLLRGLRGKVRGIKKQIDKINSKYK